MSKLHWTEAETARLLEFYPSIGAKDLQKLLPDRSPVAIKFKAVHMGIPKTHERRREVGRENVNRRWHPPEIQA